VKFSFFVMTNKGYVSLKAFIENFGAEGIEFVVAARDENTENDYYQEIRRLCMLKEVKFYDKNEEYPRHDGYCFVISWRWLLGVSGSNMIILHDSLLPRYRGYAPLVSSLINGEKIIGVTALFASEEFDKGDILLQKSLSVSYPIKIEKAIDRISELYGNIVVCLAKKFLNGKNPEAKRQDEALASYSLWLDDQDYMIDWHLDATFIKRFIDSVGYPYKGGMSFLNGRKVRIYDSEETTDVMIENRVPGKVLFLLNGIPSVVCGKGLLKITHLVDEETKKSLLPLVKLRSRFGLNDSF